MKNIEEKTYVIRKADKEDSRRIWEIRNHPIVRKYSGNPEEIPFEKHVPWFIKKYFSREDNRCFVLESRNENSLAIGYCRLDFNKELNGYVISVALDVNFHGRGLGHYFLNKILRQFGDEKNIFAEIKKGNISSIKLFQKNNFKIYKEDEENCYLEYKT
ncbi:MAG: GNAT family N-acetyltransferase [Patescibacteria group bacterium]|nr:GNAT family N-acetyltransferase [Patescibacteria group bacterium]MDD5294876.1 GNAT family N-acetyltransferase [Patescibacteria group bacterium]MDD5554644.1 GNAT family N-acetyltransferase [Patescibacteria group bacterium]